LAHAAAAQRRMMAKSDTAEPYWLSFTSGGLHLQGAPLAASLYIELGDRSVVRLKLDADNLLHERQFWPASSHVSCVA